MTFILQYIRRHKLWLVLITLCLLVQLLQLHEWLRFDRVLIHQGEYWRMLTAHLTHLGWNHLVLNMAGLAIIMLFFGHYQSSFYWSTAMLWLALLCSAGLLLDGQLQRYVGLSGVLHGLFIIGGRLEYRRYRLSGLVLLLLLTGKLIWEQLYGALPGSESMAGGRVAVNAHLYGALAGISFLLIYEIVRIVARRIGLL